MHYMFSNSQISIKMLNQSNFWTVLSGSCKYKLSYERITSLAAAMFSLDSDSYSNDNEITGQELWDV